MNTRPRLTICFLALLCILTTSGVVLPQSKDEILDRRVSEFEFIDPTSVVLTRLASRSQVPIGMEKVPEINGQAKTIAVRANGDTVRSILDFVVEKDPQYVWQRANSVINVFPRHDKDPMLETIVTRFQVSNVNKQEALELLKNSPEVKTVLTRSSLRENTLLILPGPDGDSLPRFSLELEKSSVRDILNAIMLASNRRSWVFARNGPRNEFFYLYMY
jgi:hypothetical protein